MKGVVSIFIVNNPRLEANITHPIQGLMYGLCTFSLDITDGIIAPEPALQAAASAALWCWWLGHLNRKGLDP